MNAQQKQWSLGYRIALRKYLAQGAGASLAPALAHGRRAVTLGLEPLDIARFHKQALATLANPKATARARLAAEARATRFFAEAIVPLEDTHRAARRSASRVQQLTKTLRRRTVESAAAGRLLERGIARRRTAEAALRKSTTLRSRLTKESDRLQQSLRNQTHAILSTQEIKRRRASLQLRDEIAQTLLAISLRLLTLRTSAKASTENLEREIAETQQLVQQSVSTIQRLAHEFGTHHEG